MHLKSEDQQLKTTLIYIALSKAMKTTNQKPIIDTQEQKQQPKHISGDAARVTEKLVSYLKVKVVLRFSPHHYLS